MRVLVLANIGLGLYKFRKELLQELVKDHDVYFSIPFDEYVEPIEQMGCTFFDNPYIQRRGTNPNKDIRLLLYYLKLMKTIKPDVVLTYTIKPNVYGGIACSILNIPYIVNITGLGTAVENSGILQKITIMLYRVGLRKARKVFFQNTDNRDFMLNHKVVYSNYDVLPGSGVNLDQYTLLPYPKEDTVNFVFIARVMKEKGIEQYLVAAKEIRKRYPETRFHICGFCEQDYETLLEDLSKNGMVVYHGLVSDMKPIYQMAACTVHPSCYPEGLSNVLLESAASGRPIITTDRSGCREVVEDGVNGYVVKQQDSKDLIEKIECFLNLSLEERKDMGLAGRAKVEREFDRQIVIKKYLSEVERVAK